MISISRVFSVLSLSFIFSSSSIFAQSYAPQTYLNPPQPPNLQKDQFNIKWQAGSQTQSHAHDYKVQSENANAYILKGSTRGTFQWRYYDGSTSKPVATTQDYDRPAALSKNVYTNDQGSQFRILRTWDSQRSRYVDYYVPADVIR